MSLALTISARLDLNRQIDRREFLARAAAIVVGGVSALAMAQAMFPRYAEAQTISFTDSRIRANYVEYPSPGGSSRTMRGYLVRPTSEGPFPAVLVIHENRGLNPHIEDVARRAAVEGFLALAPDGLAPVGGYPGNDDDGRRLQSSLDRDALAQDMINSARFLKAHELSTGPGSAQSPSSGSTSPRPCPERTDGRDGRPRARGRSGRTTRECAAGAAGADDQA